ncbi:phosphate acetyltransferase [candidate division KSB1 bacterium]|nr:phosphate acetyltransferase [candidate division KSB1 bacterium]
MYDFEKNLEQQIASIPKSKPTLIFPEYSEPRVLAAIAALLPYANIILPASSDTIRDLFKAQPGLLPTRVDELISQIICLDLAKMTAKKQLFARELIQISHGKKWQVDEKDAFQAMGDALTFSIMAVRMGYAEAILGGLQLASKDYFSPCLRMLKKEQTVFELGIFVLPDEHPAGLFEQNLVVFSDVAVNLTPGAEELAHIVVGTCRILRDIVPESILPQINGAIISYSTKGSGAGAAVDLVRGAGELIPDKLRRLQQQNPRYESIQIDWEFQISVAISEAAAKAKIKEPRLHPVAGHANVLTVTNLDFGNSLYHLYATTWPGALKLLQVGGIHGQALDFSRSSVAKDVVLAAKALVLQHLRRNEFRGTPRSFTA